MTLAPTLYGLPHCDTCKKARAWLTARGIAHEFVDYRAQPLAPAQLEQAAAALGWDKLVNRASTTWRQLDEADKGAETASAWLALLAHAWVAAGVALVVLPQAALWALVSAPLSLAATLLILRRAATPAQLKPALVLTITACVVHGVAMAAGLLTVGS